LNRAALICLVAAQVSRAVGNDKRADRFETKAAAEPAQTTMPAWAAEPAVAAVPDFVL
jgi:hypothetical protein